MADKYRLAERNAGRRFAHVGALIGVIRARLGTIRGGFETVAAGGLLGFICVCHGLDSFKANYLYVRQHLPQDPFRMESLRHSGETWCP